MNVEIIRSARRKKTISARLDGDTMIVQAPAEMPEKELNEAIETLRGRLLKRQAKRTLSDDDLEQRASLMNRRYFNGKLNWQSIRWVSNQNKRYGSCTPAKKTIRISHRVGTLPQWVQDYVIVHELAHLQQANHGPRFWELVNRYPLTERARGYLMALGLEEVEDPPFL
ncbi:MAG: M48 family metallopeptidase [Chloroflexi bacterium]|nr:M48 family metallopeptidase [Chloroflexota bacterium]